VKSWRYRRFFLRFYQSLPRIHQEFCWCGGLLKPLDTNPSYGVCQDCGTYVLLNPFDPAYLKKLYSLDIFWRAKPRSRAIPDIEKRGQLYRTDGRLAFWLSIIERWKPTGNQVVEVGCAPGILLQELSKRGYDCLGVELTQEVANWVHEHTGLQVISGRFPDVNLPPCDLFLAFDVLEHCYDPVGFMNKVYEVLACGGKAIIQSPIVRPEQGYDTMKPFGNNFKRMFDAKEHVFIHSSSSLRRLAELAGLSILNDKLKWRSGHEVVIFKKVCDR